MNGQLSLLDEPRARATDPRTSRLAAQSIAPAAGDLHHQIIETVRAARRPVTAEYIAHEICANSTRWDHGGIVSAVSRAHKNGHLHPCGFGLTSRGRSAQLYAVKP